MKRLRKLASPAGFTLAETLLAVLILLLVSTIVATGMPAARSAYEKVVIGSNAQATLSTVVTALRNELGTAWDISVEADGKSATYFSAETGARARLAMGTYTGVNGAAIPTIIIQDYALAVGFNDAAAGQGTERPLVSARATAGDLSVAYGTISYAYNAATGTGTVLITDLAVSWNGRPLATLEELEIPVVVPAPTATPAP